MELRIKVVYPLDWKILKIRPTLSRNEYGWEGVGNGAKPKVVSTQVVKLIPIFSSSRNTLFPKFNKNVLLSLQSEIKQSRKRS